MLDELDPDIATGQTMILNQLEDMRAGYIAGGPYPVP